MTQERNQMKIETINIEITLKKAQSFTSKDRHLQAATKAIVEILALIISLSTNRPDVR
ncbi:MAG: hypothetical protein PHY29_08950 [Syntrophales bacterium]|nr:hypothetical protein [Syntrophales bacterium]